MRIVGKLPSVALNMTDQRLTEILQLLLGIPLPESESKTEDVDELDQAVSVNVMFINCLQCTSVFVSCPKFGYVRLSASCK